MNENTIHKHDESHPTVTVNVADFLKRVIDHVKSWAEKRRGAPLKLSIDLEITLGDRKESTEGAKDSGEEADVSAGEYKDELDDELSSDNDVQSVHTD